MILIGLVDGSLVLAEVIRTNVNFTPEIQIATSYVIKGIIIYYTVTLTRYNMPVTFRLLCVITGGGAVRCLSWSINGTQFAVGSTSGHVAVFGGTGRDYSLVTEFADIQV